MKKTQKKKKNEGWEISWMILDTSLAGAWPERESFASLWEV